jgi:hypothetical protein
MNQYFRRISNFYLQIKRIYLPNCTVPNVVKSADFIFSQELVSLAMTMLRRIGWAGHLARIGEKKNACRILVGKQEGKRPLRKPRRRWVDNIKMDLRVI